MRQPLDRIETDTTLPDAADVVVIGGGIAGVSAAYMLAKRGHKVAVLEKGIVGAEQSSRNWGWCRQQGRDVGELDLMRHAIGLWQSLPQEIGRDLGFQQTGVVFVTDNPAELASWERWSKVAREHQIHSTLLTAEEAQARTPGSRKRWIGGLTTPSDGRAEPAMAAPAIAAGARRLGVQVFENCAARLLETTGGKVSAVVTERGTIRTDAVLVAGGAWSSLFCRRHGIDLPQAVVCGSVARTTPGPQVMVASTSTTGFSARPRTDGGYTVAMSGRGTVHITPSLLRHGLAFLPTFRQRRKGLKIRFGRSFFEELFQSAAWGPGDVTPFEKTRIWDPAPDPELLALAMDGFKTAYPELADIAIAESWGGAIDSLPDAVPVISSVPKMDGLYLSTGFSGHGFGIGPAAGVLAADLIEGRAPVVDPHPFRYARLVDGTRLTPDSRL